mgnify:CR=1 FL=1
MTFSLVDNPEMHDLMTATSHITGKTINRFTHIHQCPEDLLKKQEMTRKICGMCGGCVQRCMGIDMMNALSSVVKDVDTKYGTPYYERFLKFLEYFQENDLVCAGSQTDTKGDRMARPSEQWDPDQYLHVVERREDGVIVRGCNISAGDDCIAISCITNWDKPCEDVVIADCILRNADVREEAARLREGFTDMRYCFSDAETEKLISALAEATGI